jgi:hypothetical protein
MALTTGQKVGIVGSLAAMAIGGFLLAENKIRDRPRPILRQTPSLDSRVAKSTPIKGVEIQDDEKAEQPYVKFNKNEQLPFDDKFYFKNKDVKSYWQSDFYIACKKAKRALTGDGNVTAYELYQLLAKTDSREFGYDRRVITGEELERIVKTIDQNPAAFIGQLDLEKQTEKPMLTNTGKKTGAVETVKEDERKVYDAFKEDKRFSEGFRAGTAYESGMKKPQYTREQLDAYQRSREAYFNFDRNMRMPRQCQYR